MQFSFPEERPEKGIRRRAKMRKYKVGDHLQVKLSGGRIVVEATIKAILETTEGVRLQFSFGDETTTRQIVK